MVTNQTNQKTSDLEPGDIIEWIYTHDRSLVSQDETLWSTLENRYVPIGLTSLLIWVTDTEYAWLTPEGLFHARRDDTRSKARAEDVSVVVPRTQG